MQALANELIKNLKTPCELSQFNRLRKKIDVEAALNAEMFHHLGYGKNNLNRVPTPATAVPQKQLPPEMSNQTLALRAKGMTPPKVTAASKELYDADISPKP